jgi:CheY-like chemotaxis protein
MDHNDNASICVVDDDDIYLFTIRKMIEMAAPQQKVLVFKNGQQALDYFKEQVSYPTTFPKAILLDINMPVMDGWEFLEQFEHLRTNIHQPYELYVVSSSIVEKDKNRAKSFCFVKDFISKPLDKQTVKQLLLSSGLMLGATHMQLTFDAARAVVESLSLCS